MVWGMSFPSSFGDYWPLGDYQGWNKALDKYFTDEMPREMKAPFLERGPVRYHRYVTEKFKRELGVESPDPSLPPLSSIKPHEPPQCFQTKKIYNSLGSFMALNDGLFAVDEALKSIIEKLEPRMHQFFPIEILMPRGKVYPVRYYILVIGQYFDSFSPEDSNLESWRRFETDNYYYHFEENARAIKELAFSKGVFGNAHLWRERRTNSLFTCFSDELQAGIVEAGLRIPKHYKMKEVNDNIGARDAQEAA